MAKDSQDSTLEQEALQNGATGAQASEGSANTTNGTETTQAEVTPTPETTDTEAEKETVAATDTESTSETTAAAEKEQAMALALMKEVNVTKIWRTAVDGYWFSKEDMAIQHHKRVGGDLKEFVNNEKK